MEEESYDWLRSWVCLGEASWCVSTLSQWQALADSWGTVNGSWVSCSERKSKQEKCGDTFPFMQDVLLQGTLLTPKISNNQNVSGWRLVKGHNASGAIATANSWLLLWVRIWGSSREGFPANSATIPRHQTLGSFIATSLLFNPLFNLTRRVKTYLFWQATWGRDQSSDPVIFVKHKVPPNLRRTKQNLTNPSKLRKLRSRTFAQGNNQKALMPSNRMESNRIELHMKIDCVAIV